MNRRGYGKFRFAAVSVLVVLALTGFSTSSHGGTGKSGSGKSRSGGSRHSGSSGGGGGGCSSSSQDHDETDDDDTSSGQNSSTTVQDAQVELVSCVTKTDPYATVTVTNPNSTGDYFTVTVGFLDADSDQVEERTASEYVAGNDTTTVRVDLSTPALAAKIDHCEPEPYAPVD
ncbi:hypothetical protein ABZ464_38775 [Streptomyces sp. NPDC005820]|uniref:hypothetical protein n=1 Tax=Streptomyces sp. NPDC005820 TaxID=3157069 RepID=UPI0033C8749C